MKAKFIERLRPAHETLIVKRLQAEWQEAERALKKHELIEKAKTAGIKAGKFILGAALTVGVVTIAAVMPGVFVVMGKLAAQRRFFTSEELPKELSRGSSRKYWRYQKTSDTTYRIVLTKYGRKLAMRNALQKFKLSTQPRWDGKWRVVMFDIPKKHSTLRDALRWRLREIGMQPIQKSVFAYPYPCAEEVAMWIELYGLEKGVELLDAHFNIDTERKLRVSFNLKK